MSRNIIVCCDGTNNEFGTCNTNVVRLVQVLADEPPGSQLVYYDPGIGTLPEPGWATRAGRWASETLDLAFATGLGGKLERAYTYLMDVWQPGDRVFLFGFSRGAYTARVLAGLLHSVGLLPPRSQNLVPYALRLFDSIRGTDGEDERRGYWKLSNQFRNTFARPIPGAENRRFAIAFLGLWDTVSSVGWVWDPKSFPYTARNPSVRVVRHAVSLDERRAFFRQNLILPAKGQDAEERWFAGAHCDVGGGYREEQGRLWTAAFEWITREAARAGLLVDENRLREMLNTKVESSIWQERVNSSLTRSWWLGEVFPKLSYQEGRKYRLPRLGLGRAREVREGAMLDLSVLQRIHYDETYRPRNLAPAFIERVKQSPPSQCQPYQL